MISKIEWDLTDFDASAREALVAREVGDFIAKGGKIIHAISGETGLIYFPGKGYISKRKSEELEARAEEIKRERAQNAFFVGDRKGGEYFQRLSTVAALRLA